MTRYEFESKLKDFLDNHLESYYFDTETFFEDGQGYVSTDANGKPHNINFNLGVLIGNFTDNDGYDQF